MEILFCCFYHVTLSLLILNMLGFDSTSYLYVDHCLHNLFSLPAPTLTTSFRAAQAIFRAKPFHVYVYPTFSTSVTPHTYSSGKMKQTERPETLAFKLQTSEDNSEKSIWHLDSYFTTISIKEVRIKSGVPQVSALGSSLFLAYVRVLGVTIKLFANDCIIHRKITVGSDIETLQIDLVRLGEWVVENVMNINPGKSKAASFTRTLMKDLLH
jgi:hypothetical protein